MKLFTIFEVLQLKVFNKFICSQSVLCICGFGYIIFYTATIMYLTDTCKNVIRYSL